MGVPGAKRGLIALALLAGCGGVSTRNQAAEESGASGTAGAGGHTSTGGSGSLGGGTSEATTNEGPPPLSNIQLDDAFPWFLQAHGGPYGPAPAAQNGVVDVVFEGSPIENTLSTHNHVEVVNFAKGVTFRAKASRALALALSVHSTLDSDYFAARDAGNEWPTAPTPVTTDWATFEVELKELRPPEVKEPSAPPAFTLAFIVEAERGPVELWLDDVRFF